MNRDYMTRDCGMLALAVAYLAGWEAVETDWPEPAPRGIHCLVRLPSGELLDAEGLHAAHYIPLGGRRGPLLHVSACTRPSRSQPPGSLPSGGRCPRAPLGQRWPAVARHPAHLGVMVEADR
jgi:hypothetical protein